MEEIKKLLLKMREEIIRDINAIRESEHAEHNEIGDEYDLASQERERELGIIMSAQEKNKLMAIEDALRRIEEGTYGYCEECGDKISKQRLKAVPFATLCVSCKARKEAKEGIFTPFEEEEVESFEEETEETLEEEE
ncbi:MAG: TraR/DksA family transcriptional regulator [Proteobacteria bacterium]|nr:TraR/DksA family transcriptional regulator [Pseudomonadota bacterium]